MSLLRDTIIFVLLIAALTVTIRTLDGDRGFRHEQRRIARCIREARSHYPDEAFWKNFEAGERRLCVDGF